jgi:uncharacterized protein YbjQ (UPF0145 family)
MIVTTLDHVAGQQIGDTLGLVRGTSTWTRRVTKSYAGGIRSTHAHGMRDLEAGLASTRSEATEAAKREAASMGATAIVGFQTEVRELSEGVYMVNVTGTAVKTYRFPAPMPALSDDGELPVIGMVHFAFAGERASFEGSSLRH